ncbi:lipocalin family protein [Puniceicoccaceae bacterium K14]|nr:lipocalin family protein [Puniceicoccaceae bacterium K14]
MLKSNIALTLITLALLAFLVGRSYSTPEPNQKLAEYVDIDRFMGKWYVHGYTPTFLDRDAFGGIEEYEMGKNGKVLTTYSFKKGGPKGKRKTYRPRARVKNTKTNAVWKMRFFGMITANYYVVYVDENYQETVIGHPNKKYAWVMSRDSNITPERYAGLKEELHKRDYDLETFKRMAH